MALFLCVFLVLAFCGIVVFVKWLLYIRNYDEAVKAVNCIVKSGSAFQKYERKNHVFKRDYDVLIMSRYFGKMLSDETVSHNQITHCGKLMMAYFQEKLANANNLMKRYYIHVFSCCVSVAMSFVIYHGVQYIENIRGFLQSDIYDNVGNCIAVVVLLCVCTSILLSIPSFKVQVDDEGLAYQLWLISMSVYMGDSTKSSTEILFESYDFAPVSIRLEIAQLIQRVKEDEGIVEPCSYVMNELKDREVDATSKINFFCLKAIAYLDLAPYMGVFAKVIVDVLCSTVISI